MRLTPEEIATLAEAVANRVVEKLSGRPRLVDRYELAKLMSVSVPTIERLSAVGEIPIVRMGRRVLYDPVAVIEARSEKKGAKKNG